MIFNNIKSLFEEVSNTELNKYLKEFQNRIDKSNLNWKRLPVTAKLDRMIDNQELCPSDIQRDDNGKYIIRINKNIENKETAKRLLYHELVHAYTYDQEEGHEHKYSGRAKTLNNKFFAGGEYIPIHAEKDSWQEWAAKRNPKFKHQRESEKKLNELVNKLRSEMKSKGFNVYKRSQIISGVLDYFQDNENIDSIANLSLDELTRKLNI